MENDCMNLCQDKINFIFLIIISILIICGIILSNILLVILAFICSGIYVLYLFVVCHQRPQSCALCLIIPLALIWIVISVVWCVILIGNRFFPPYGGYIMIIMLTFAYILYGFITSIRKQTYCMDNNSPEYNDIEEIRSDKEKITSIDIKVPSSISILKDTQKENSYPSTTSSNDEITPIVKKTKDYKTVNYVNESKYATGVSTPCCCVAYGVVKV